jgi:hypothetical protein
MQVLAVAASMFIAGFFLSAAVKKYQVTGPVLEVNDKMIAVDKSGDRWELERNADTKVTGTLKVGAKVTVHYRMVATEVEVKWTVGSNLCGAARRDAARLTAEMSLLRGSLLRRRCALGTETE